GRVRRGGGVGGRLGGGGGQGRRPAAGPGAGSTRRGERARRREPRLNGAGGGRRAALPSPRGGARVRVGAARSEWRAGDGPVPARSVLLRAGRARGPGSGRPRAAGVVPPLAAA